MAVIGLGPCVARRLNLSTTPATFARWHANQPSGMEALASLALSILRPVAAPPVRAPHAYIADQGLGAACGPDLQIVICGDGVHQTHSHRPESPWRGLTLYPPSLSCEGGYKAAGACRPRCCLSGEPGPGPYSDAVVLLWCCRSRDGECANAHTPP